jgi:hypothetical protein
MKVDKLGRRRAPHQERGLITATRPGRSSRSHNVSLTPVAHARLAALTPVERGDLISRALRRGQEPTVTTDTVFVTYDLGQSDPVTFVLDAMQGYDSELYRAEIAAGRLDDLVAEEWANVWTQGENTFLTREAADASLDESGHLHIIEITREHVREALRRL